MLYHGTAKTISYIGVSRSERDRNLHFLARIRMPVSRIRRSILRQLVLDRTRHRIGESILSTLGDDLLSGL